MNLPKSQRCRPAGRLDSASPKTALARGSGRGYPAPNEEPKIRPATLLNRRAASHRSFRENSPPCGVNGMTGANKHRFMDLFCGASGFRLATELPHLRAAVKWATPLAGRTRLL